jgi:hypothetical protein
MGEIPAPDGAPTVLLYSHYDPGKGGLGTFATLLDSAGNSVKGQFAAAFLTRRLGLDLFASKPLPNK